MLSRGSIADGGSELARWSPHAWVSALPRWAPTVLVFAAALLLRGLFDTHTDVSWGLSIAEKMLGGQRLYVDILEVNPPATAFLHLAPVLLARATGVSPEIMMDWLVLLAAAGGLWLSGRVLVRGRMLDGIDGWRLTALVAAVVTVLPAYNFAEREHIAVIALLPLLAVLAVRAEGRRPDFAMAVIAGLGAGITVVIKPHFALAIMLAVGAAAANARSWRVVFAVENWIGVIVACAYAAAVVVAYPEFVGDVLPMVVAVYVPARLPILTLLARPAVLCWLASLRILTHWKPGALLAAPTSILVASSTGFFVAYLIQGKGWPYHTYPMLALGFMALAVVGLSRPRAEGPADGRFRRAVSALTVPALAAVCYFWFSIAGSTDPLIEPIRRVSLHPRMLMISPDLAIGHPLVRQLGGTWVGRTGHLWISAGAFERLVKEKPDAETAAALRRLAARDRDMLVEDIRRNRPDVILIERGVFDWYAFAHADPAIAAELAAYTEIAAVDLTMNFLPNGTVVVLGRNKGAGPAAAPMAGPAAAPAK